jgi:glycosyltransferase involved in cell wall biosynthesis
VAVPLSFMNIRKPMVVILQFPESPLRSRLIKWSGITKKWAGVGTVAREAKDFLQSRLDVPPGKIFQYYAARTDFFKPSEDDRQKPDGPILSIGVAKRDYTTLIEALSDLPGYETEIFVSSKYGDEYKGGKAGTIPDWIRFPARMSDEELRCRYLATRFVVVPLENTPHSGAGVTSIFEASASGKAVIATNTGGMHSYIVDGKTGILVPPGDVEAMRTAIKKLWENPDLAQEMGRAGRKFVEENYDYYAVVDGITAFLSKLWDAVNSGDVKSKQA